MGAAESHGGDGRGRGLVAGVVGLRPCWPCRRGPTPTRRVADRETTPTALADTNAELTRSKAAVQARYDLAVDAIKTFHTGVSEDFLLKEDQFKGSATGC